MKHIVIWHGPVSDVEYEVEADSKDDAVAEAAALCEGNEAWLKEHEEIGPIAVLGGMPKLTDLPGRRFGRLVAVERVGTRLGHPEWRCRCDCGSECVVTSNALRKGCGCLRREFLNRLSGVRLSPCPPSLPI